MSERLANVPALAILSSDPLSSVAYATEEMLLILVLAGTVGLKWSLPIGIAIGALLAIVVISYRQLIRAYPEGGGAYTVAKANLGTTASLVAVSGLLIDYILTVAVSVAAGIDALVSAFHGLSTYRVELAILVVVVIMLVNLRGLRDTGRAFTVPTLFFVAAMAAVIVTGLYKMFVLHTPVQDLPALPATSSVGLFLLLRAFSSGCTALTGIEAVSNSTQAFKPPESVNARKVMLWSGILMLLFFLGTTFLARHFNVLPAHDQTVLSQLGRVVFGVNTAGRILHYALQIATLLILVFAANTAFTGFPRLCSRLGNDGYLPRQLSDVGSRLVYSNGIIVLAFTSALLLSIFQASVNKLIPIYAVGVFISFTLSQTGLVRHWLQSRDEGWLHGVIINGIGAVATAIALIVIVTTKFTHGAWLITLLIPLLLWFFSRVHHHYEMVAEELTLEGFTPPTVPLGQKVIVPVSGLHRAVLEALVYARAISKDVQAVYVSSDPAEAEVLQRKWKTRVSDVPLEVIYSPYRQFIFEFLKYLDKVQKDDKAMVAVLIPEFVPRHWWEHFLHRQTALMLKTVLLYRRGIPVISVPHQLRR